MAFPTYAIGWRISKGLGTVTTKISFLSALGIPSVLKITQNYVFKKVPGISKLKTGNRKSFASYKIIVGTQLLKKVHTFYISNKIKQEILRKFLAENKQYITSHALGTVPEEMVHY